MDTIYEYELPEVDRWVSLPSGAIVLYATGVRLPQPRLNHKFVGTVLLAAVDAAWHVYEIV